MANVFYLDVDDEITSAAARIRSSEDPRVGLVVPPGSRIATSRINFRLLAREALERNRGALDRVRRTPPPGPWRRPPGCPSSRRSRSSRRTRAPSVPRARPGLDQRPRAPARRNPPARAAPSRRPGAARAGAAGNGRPDGGLRRCARCRRHRRAGGLRSAADARVGARSVGTAAPAVRGASRTSRASARVAAGIVTVLIMVLVLGLIGVFLLPSATITVTPRLTAVGPLQLSIRADPNRDLIGSGCRGGAGRRPDDGLHGLGHVQRDGHEGQHDTGVGNRHLHQQRHGQRRDNPVRLQGRDRERHHVRDNPGHHVPRARFKPSFRPGTASVGVTAVTPGRPASAGRSDRPGPRRLQRDPPERDEPGGDDRRYEDNHDPDPEEGHRCGNGRLDEEPQGPVHELAGRPGGLAPGSTAFPKTGLLGAITPDNDPATLIGVTQGDLRPDPDRVRVETAVDQSSISSLAATRVDTTVPTDFTLVAGSEKVTIGTPRTDGAAVVFPVTATASQVRQLDADTLRQQVLGKSVDEARSILAQDGTVDIQTWPGFVGTIPSLAWRLTLTVDTERDHGLARTGCFAGRRLQPALERPIQRAILAAIGGALRRRPRARLEQRMSRLLGIDLGERRIGIAVADPDGRARPLQTLRRARTIAADAEAIQRLDRPSRPRAS